MEELKKALETYLASQPDTKEMDAGHRAAFAHFVTAAKHLKMPSAARHMSPKKTERLVN